MTLGSVRTRVQHIVSDAQALKEKYAVKEKSAPVNYACVFTRSEHEFEMFLREAQKHVIVDKDTRLVRCFLLSP